MTSLAKRQCGSCNACCVVLEIATPQLHKKARVPCQHLSESGCGIYAARPGVCQQFLCGWRLFAELDDSWRPDRSGVLMLRMAPTELPPAWRHAPYGLHLVVIGGEEAVLRPAFIGTVARLLAQGIPVFLSAASPYILLNDHIPAQVDSVLLKTRLTELYALLHAARFERGLWKRLWPLYRLQLDRQRQKFQAKSDI